MEEPSEAEEPAYGTPDGEAYAYDNPEDVPPLVLVDAPSGDAALVYDGPVPTCVRKRCVGAPMVASGTVPDCLTGKLFGDTCELQCDRGYAVDGEQSVSIMCDVPDAAPPAVVVEEAPSRRLAEDPPRRRRADATEGFTSTAYPTETEYGTPDPYGDAAYGNESYGYDTSAEDAAAAAAAEAEAAAEAAYAEACSGDLPAEILDLYAEKVPGYEFGLECSGLRARAGTARLSCTDDLTEFGIPGATLCQLCCASCSRSPCAGEDLQPPAPPCDNCAGWTAPGDCRLRTCDGTSATFADSVDRTCGNRASRDVALQGSCTRMCAAGFSLGGLTSKEGLAIEFSCALNADGDAAVLTPTGGVEKCEPLGCLVAPKELGLGSYSRPLAVAGQGCVDDTPLQHGVTCKVSCPTGEPAIETTTHLTCIAGRYSGCTDGTCNSLVAAPQCFATGTELVTKEVISSAMAVSMSTEDIQRLRGDPDAARAAFEKALTGNLGTAVVVTRVIFPQTSSTRRLQESGGVITVEFYVEDLSAESKILDLSTGASTPSLVTMLNMELEAAFEGFTGVQAIAVRPPEKITIRVPPSLFDDDLAAAEAAAGAWRNAMIGVVVLFFISLAAFGYWYKRHGGREKIARFRARGKGGMKGEASDTAPNPYLDAEFAEEGDAIFASSDAVDVEMPVLLDADDPAAAEEDDKDALAAQDVP
jgi:hypothetical protein